MIVREYTENDLAEMIKIWNEVVEDGIAFPQEEFLNAETGAEFFALQSYCGVADDNGKVVGLGIRESNQARFCPSLFHKYCVKASCKAPALLHRFALSLQKTNRAKLRSTLNSIVCVHFFVFWCKHTVVW